MENMEIFDCVLLQNTSNVTRGEREIRFQSSLLRMSSLETPL